MAFFQTNKCQCCGKEEYMDADNQVCSSCKTEIKKQHKIDWLNKRKCKIFEERLDFIEDFIYNNFVSEKEIFDWRCNE